MAFQYYNGQILTLDGASIDGPRPLPGFSGMTPVDLDVNYVGTTLAQGPLSFIPYANDGPFPIGFNFTFFNMDYSTYYVSENGRITFDDVSTQYATNADIPNVALPNNYIAPYWDNLYFALTNGAIKSATIGLQPNRKHIIHWDYVQLQSSGDLGSFFLILEETTNKIHFQYKIISDFYTLSYSGGSATIGIENSTGTSGVKYSYNINNAINTGKAISFTPSASSYILNADELYDPVFISSNPTTTKKPLRLLNPSPDACVNNSCRVYWEPTGDVSFNYNLQVSYFPGGGGSHVVIQNIPYTQTYYDLNLSTNVQYWSVYPQDFGAQAESYRIFVSSAPVLNAAKGTYMLRQNKARMIRLFANGGNTNPNKTATITSVPRQGELHQYMSDGSIGDWIYYKDTLVTDPSMRVFYIACGSTGNRAGSFSYKVYDGSTYSLDASITINILP